MWFGFFSLCLSRFFPFVLLPVFLYFSFTPSSDAVVKKRKKNKVCFEGKYFEKVGKKNRNI